MSWQQNICRKDIFAFCKLKPTLIKAGMCHIQDESKEEIAYAQDMFETIFRDYRQEKDDYFSEKMQRDLIRLMH